MTTETILTLALPISFLLFVIGILFGWIARDYMLNYREIPRPHPEMFDINGNLVPDEIVAFRFEDYDEDTNNEEDDTVQLLVFGGYDREGEDVDSFDRCCLLSGKVSDFRLTHYEVLKFQAPNQQQSVTLLEPDLFGCTP